MRPTTHFPARSASNPLSPTGAWGLNSIEHAFSVHMRPMTHLTALNASNPLSPTGAWGLNSMSFYGLLDTPRLRDGVGRQRKLIIMLASRRMSFYGLLDAPRLRDRVGPRFNTGRWRDAGKRCRSRGRASEGDPCLTAIIWNCSFESLMRGKPYVQLLRAS